MSDFDLKLPKLRNLGDPPQALDEFLNRRVSRTPRTDSGVGQLRVTHYRIGGALSLRRVIGGADFIDSHFLVLVD